MSYRGTPGEISEEIRLLPINLRRNIRAAEAETLREARDVAQAYSQGPYSLKQLASMGHPYAKRDPRPPMTPGQINRQSGVFTRSFVVRLAWSGNVLRGRLLNTSREWRYLKGGTRKMIARSLGMLVAAKIRGPRLKRLQQAVARTLHP